MLNSYIASTQRLLQFPNSPTTLYTTSDLTSYINTARGQLAGEAKCIRPDIANVTLSLTLGTRSYPFSSVAIAGGSGATGIQGILNIRMALYVSGTGLLWVRPRPFEWFTRFKLSNPVPASGAPQTWAQNGQGVSGTVYIDPLPDTGYTIQADVHCYPINLVDDSTFEAIPYPWTDAVPFLAAYYALLSAQSGARQDDANRMYERYEEFRDKARRMSTPDVLPGIYPQQPNPVRANQLAQQPAQGGG